MSRTNNLENNEKSINPSWFTLCTDFNRKIFKQFNRNDIKISYYGTNKLNKFIKVHNINPLDFFSKSNVVYKINCKLCISHGTNGKEAENSDFRISKSYTMEYQSKSIITDHRSQLGHDFDWNNIQILDKSIYNKMSQRCLTLKIE